MRDYVIELHQKMLNWDRRPLVVTDGQAFLEGRQVNADNGAGSGLDFCLVYDVSDDRISAIRCYGTLAHVLPAADAAERHNAS